MQYIAKTLKFYGNVKKLFKLKTYFFFNMKKLHLKTISPQYNTQPNLKPRPKNSNRNHHIEKNKRMSTLLRDFIRCFFVFIFFIFNKNSQEKITKTHFKIYFCLLHLLSS